MVFSSVSFLVYFLPIVICVYYLVPSSMKNLVLLGASLFFYAWGEPVYVLLMIFSIMCNYTFGRILHSLDTAKEPSHAMKTTVFIAIIVNLGVLGFFKYGDFLIENINAICSTSIELMDLPLPIGISFYTFQAMSYIIDLYRGKVKVQKNIVAFGTYVALFPQLIAGPIVRFQSIEEQLVSRHVDMKMFASGVRRFTIGLAKKVLLANNMGILWESISSVNAANSADIATLTAWLGAVAFTFQIYFDFSGYSDMAIGLGKMFGFEFLENFNYPYISRSVTEFWRRWHISLSSWFKEYVYIPLGGNRKGNSRQIFNIFIVWSLTGLWHGASWNFVLWGVYFALLLVAEKLWIDRLMRNFQERHIRVGNWIGHIYTMLFVMVSWVIFAIEDLQDMAGYLINMAGMGTAGIVNEQTMYLLSNNFWWIMICIVGVTKLPNKTFFAARNAMRGKGSVLFALVECIGLLLLLVTGFAYVVASTYNPFLYFRF